MHRNRTWNLTDTEAVLRTQRNRVLPIAGPSGCLSDNKPDAVTRVAASALSASSIDVSWDPDTAGGPNEATFWEVERSPNGSTGWTQVAVVVINAYVDTGLAASTQYWYRVIAGNCYDKTPPSATANATTQAGTVPADPTGVSASPSTDGTAVAVTITWTDASANEDGFYVYRNTTNTTVGATLVNGVGAGVQTYTDDGANSGGNAPAVNTTYYYWVSAHNGIGESTKVAASQNATGGVTTLNVPAAPTSLTATATSTTQIDLAWTDNATNETGYIVQRRSPAGSGGYSQIATLSAGANSYSNTGLTESVQYEYRVYATNAAGASANSNAASKFTIPATPTGLTATAVSSSQIDLSWTDVSTGNTGQRIERRSPSGSGSYSTLTTVSATATTYSDTGLTASTSYEYRIVATNADYDSSPSTAANATTQSGALSPSWTLDFSSGTPSGYTLTRASSGTYVDSSGYIASAATDVARLTHNSSGTRLGLLVEESRTNEFQYSEDPANAYWTKSGSGINNNSGAFWTAPDNASTAVLLRQNTSSAAHYMSRTVGSQTARMNSVFVKKQNLTGGSGRAGKYATLLLSRSGTEYYHATFDLDAGTVTQSAVVGTVISSTDRGIEAFKDDWYRIWVRGTASTSGNLNFVLALATNDSSGTPAMTANGES
jgi:titin